MKKILSRVSVTAYILFLSCAVWAQEKAIEINESAVENWFQRNWFWVAAGVILLMIIFMAGSGKSTRTTTTYRREDGTVTKTTTTVEE